MWQPGWEGNLGENGCMFMMAEPLYCSLETITTLLIGYTPVQNLKDILKFNENPGKTTPFSTLIYADLNCLPSWLTTPGQGSPHHRNYLNSLSTYFLSEISFFLFQGLLIGVETFKD